ncbi:hypothetical protein CspeluHIS016_0402120 [Cutaneotrichosporon spelunceum]|uniref:WSC domain-containing protein n=1 Tax=Cutaneotrichosporon spelunceum TaxID=1672016 RepID=A0AAD3TVH4_9TREE|nr:hypothetical protein CspeluHIS016_0402120 [Cutaneotrichosporon spelunceum]
MLSLLVLTLPVISASVVSNLEIRDDDTEPVGWKPYGCHFDCYDGMNRYLPYMAYASDYNTPRMCTEACAKEGYKFAGVQFARECWCGNEIRGQPTNDMDCFMECPFYKCKCGGPCRNFIYGLE